MSKRTFEITNEEEFQIIKEILERILKVEDTFKDLTNGATTVEMIVLKEQLEAEIDVYKANSSVHQQLKEKRLKKEVNMSLCRKCKFFKYNKFENQGYCCNEKMSKADYEYISCVDFAEVQENEK